MPSADRALVERIAAAIWDKKGFDVRAYDVVGVVDYTDAVVICSAAADRHASAIGDGVIQRLRDDLGMRTVSEEGMRGGRWILLDFGEVVVHVFHRPVREYYDLDRLFADCPRIHLEEPAWVREITPSDFASADDFDVSADRYELDWDGGDDRDDDDGQDDDDDDDRDDDDGQDDDDDDDDADDGQDADDDDDDDDDDAADADDEHQRHDSAAADDPVGEVSVSAAGASEDAAATADGLTARRGAPRRAAIAIAAAAAGKGPTTRGR